MEGSAIMTIQPQHATTPGKDFKWGQPCRAGREEGAITLVNISYFLILSTGGMGKICEHWEDIMVGQKNWQTFKDHFLQVYSYYKIRKKEMSSVHGCWYSANRTQEKDSQMMTAYAL